MRAGSLTLVVGRSGSGKNYICEIFGLSSIPSFTTRSMRVSEIQGREHIFSTDEIYKQHRHSNKVAAYTFFNGYHYWTTFDEIQNLNYDVYIIDPRGVDDLLYSRMKYNATRATSFHIPEFKVVVVTAGLFTRIRNMRRRKDNWSNIISRIFNDRKEFRQFEKNAKQNGYSFINL
jgi:guanylate kinase